MDEGTDHYPGRRTGSPEESNVDSRIKGVKTQGG